MKFLKNLFSKRIELDVHIAFDDEARVWYVSHSDIVGLSLEADTAHGLIRRVIEVAPELIELNLAEISRFNNAKNFALKPVFDSPMRLAQA